MGYTPCKAVYRLAREQVHLNKAKLWRSKFPYLDQWKSCLVSQPFVSSCRFNGLRATGQNICYSGVNCALGPSKSIRYSGVRYSGFCFYIFYCNSAGFSYVVRYNGAFVIAGCYCMKVLEPIHLQTSGFVQVCQHLLDLFTCRSQMFLSVQSPTDVGGCASPEHFLGKPQGFIDPGIDRRRQHYHCWTTGIHSRVPSSAGGRWEKPGSFA